MIVLTLFLVIFAVYLTFYVMYQTALFGANAFIPDAAPYVPARVRRFNVVVPAHNEELYLPRLLASLRSQDYPADRHVVTVIADNCSDGTAKVSRPFEVTVLERTDSDRRGKGYAIGWMLERVDLQSTDALVIVDGDSIVDASFLKHLNLQMDRGDDVIQCYNAIANPDQSWFTRLMNVSRTIANEIIHPGKRKLGLSSHLMGNGMCFATHVIRSLGWNAFSVGEDWEYYARLILSGTSVGYSRQARVYHQESVNLQQASSQRLRWSGSRFQMLRRYGPSLFAQGFRTRSLTCLDASLPLVFPNPSLAINLTVVGLAFAAAASFVTGDSTLLGWYAVLAIVQFLMFVVGVLYTRNKTASALSLFMAPAFLLWKLGIDLLSLGGVGTKHWKPTVRKL